MEGAEVGGVQINVWRPEDEQMLILVLPAWQKSGRVRGRESGEYLSEWIILPPHMMHPPPFVIPG